MKTIVHLNCDDENDCPYPIAHKKPNSFPYTIEEILKPSENYISGKLMLNRAKELGITSDNTDGYFDRDDRFVRSSESSDTKALGTSRILERLITIERLLKEIKEEIK